MVSTPPTLRHWHAPMPDELGDSYVEFARKLAQPTWITIDGEDDSRSRAIVTLLHGNEPSGLKAIFEFLKSGRRPATNLGIVVASVNAALLDPPFSHRYLPDEADLNRCFIHPATTDQQRLAGEILKTLKAFSPEAVIDTHNTSGHSEAFAVATRDDAATVQLAQRFTRRLVVLDLRLGTLIEHATATMPIVTVEFGGFTDPRADQLAAETLRSFIVASDLFDMETQPMMLLRHPHRLEVDDSTELHYSASVQERADVTMFNTVDQLNFSRVEAGQPLGWLDPGGVSHLKVRSADGADLVADYFEERDGFLVTSRPIVLFMATTDAYIAKRDCLLYLTPAE